MVLLLASCERASNARCITKADNIVEIAQSPIGGLHFPRHGASEIKPIEVPKDIATERNKSLSDPLNRWHNITMTEKIKGGTLVGYDDGEWGGELLFVPDLGEKPAQLKYVRVKFAFKIDDKIYIVSGLSHLSSSIGAISQLDTHTSVPNIRMHVDLPSESRRILATENNEVVFITATENFALSASGQIRKCPTVSSWGLF